MIQNSSYETTVTQKQMVFKKKEMKNNCDLKLLCLIFLVFIGKFLLLWTKYGMETMFFEYLVPREVRNLFPLSCWSMMSINFYFSNIFGTLKSLAWFLDSFCTPRKVCVKKFEFFSALFVCEKWTFSSWKCNQVSSPFWNSMWKLQ